VKKRRQKSHFGGEGGRPSFVGEEEDGVVVEGSKNNH